MIGVIANPVDYEVVCEFFELFKTPWEFYRASQQYDVVLGAADESFNTSARLVLVYAAKEVRLDDERNLPISKRAAGLCVLTDKVNQIPIYGGAVSFPRSATGLLTHQDSGECAAFWERTGDTTCVRVGYDLFGEVRTLLTSGQPPAQAHLPTLELHIAFLRRFIIGCGIELVEIPPVPEGYRFIACLTHDVDHPSLRKHQWDSTAIGFLFRALFESCWNLLRGHISASDLFRNWFAALKLPFVQLGWADDFWGDFDELYLELERGLPSTFFLIPFHNRPGRKTDGPAPARRASGYGARELAETVRKLKLAGHEVGLHGIDAWLDEEAARNELREIQALTGTEQTGTRMHWLYNNQESPAILEKAGAAYDSTSGYNETVGYRAGVTQVFKPLGAREMLELPLHVMDTALFYHSYLGLTRRQATKLVGTLIENASRLGGCLTVNWHDRSLAPERLWGTVYSELLAELKRRGAWFASAGTTVAWFRQRRAAVFEAEASEPGATRVRLTASHDVHLPGLQLRAFGARTSRAQGESPAHDYMDSPVAVRSDSPCRLQHEEQVRHSPAFLDATRARELPTDCCCRQSLGRSENQ